MKSFMDEDWTGLTHRQIWRKIVAEIEEKEKRKSSSQKRANDMDKDGQKYACRSLLAILQSVIYEQVNAKRLDKSVGSYIFEAVKHEASSKGWIIVQ
jgi:hypothetical protein